MAKCRSVHELRTALRSLPKDLDETYTRILAAIERNRDQAHVLKILQLRICGVGGVTVASAAEIIAFELDSEVQFETQRHLVDCDEVLNMCSVLISVKRKEGRYGALPQTTYIRIAHFSIQEFLLSERIRSGQARHWSLSIPSSNVFIADAFVTYLLWLAETDPDCTFEPWFCRYRSFADAMLRPPLADMASSDWLRHLQVAEASDIACGPIALRISPAKVSSTA